MARPKSEAPKHDEESAKKRILEAAENLFSAKGFDAATIGGIGKQAGVNSALLYYYFTNKEAILHELMASAVREAVAVVEQSFSKIGVADIDAIAAFMGDVLLFLRSKKNSLKIMLNEIMRADRENAYIFELLSPVYELAQKKLREIDGFTDPVDTNYLRIKLFFIYTAPLMLSVVIGDEWKAFHKIGEAEFQIKFLGAMKEIAVLLDKKNLL
ncbi:MAG: hypothetical protein A2Y33_05825 [Spirochaetes bacterium GWF1_51_8]|nr:MAG: hypothetical protein A2Y33_05825 [Spirochaetes bacterium GWF1_51_8]